MKQNVFFGGSGRLGKAFMADKCDWLAPSHREVDITCYRQVFNYLDAVQPDCVVHAAAVVGARETEADKLLTCRVNVTGTYNIAEACLKLGIRLLYISSVSVFDGYHGPYSEQDQPIPGYFYGWTKLAGEQSVVMVPNSVIIRTDFFVPGELKYTRVFTDHYCSKISVDEVSWAIMRVAQSGFRGILHVGQQRDTLFNILRPHAPHIIGISIAESSLPSFPPDLSLDVSLYEAIFKTND